MKGWDRADVARAYESFNARYDRYRDANDALALHAELAGDFSVLDVGAGTGRTAEAALSLLGPGARVVCFEPAAAMRTVGEGRLRDPRVEWTGALPEGDVFDRVLCGAAIWAVGSLRETVLRLAEHVAGGGALAFTIPALYVGIPDEAGGGPDPLLLEIPALLAEGRVPAAEPIEPLPDAESVGELLAAAGLRPERWELRRRMTQAELRDWLKIPVLTDALLGDIDAGSRAARVDAAYARAHAGSWRWERWLGWTAWREAA